MDEGQESAVAETRGHHTLADVISKGVALETHHRQ